MQVGMLDWKPVKGNGLVALKNIKKFLFQDLITCKGR